MVQFALVSTLLLSPGDAPVAGAMTPQPAQVPAGWGYAYAAGAAAAIVAVPASIYLGAWLGSLSNNLIASAVPVLLSIGLIPPLAVTAVTVLVSNKGAPGRYRWWPAFLGTLLVNGASLALAASGGLSAGVVGRVVVYTLVQAVLQPGVAVALERAWPNPQPTVISAPSDPVAPRTFVVPTGAWSF